MSWLGAKNGASKASWEARTISLFFFFWPSRPIDTGLCSVFAGYYSSCRLSSSKSTLIGPHPLTPTTTVRIVHTPRRLASGSPRTINLPVVLPDWPKFLFLRPRGYLQLSSRPLFSLSHQTPPLTAQLFPSRYLALAFLPASLREALLAATERSATIATVIASHHSPRSDDFCKEYCCPTRPRYHCHPPRPPPPRPPPPRQPAVRARGRVCQGPKPLSRLLLSSPSSPHPTRLPMKRPTLRPPRPPTPHRSGNSTKPLSPPPPSRPTPDPRPPDNNNNNIRRRRQPTTTIPSRPLCPPVERWQGMVLLTMIDPVQASQS